MTDIYKENRDLRKENETLKQTRHYLLYKQMKREFEEANRAVADFADINLANTKRIMQLQEDNLELKEQNNLFKDPYFQGMTPEDVIQLAKKAIRVVAENRKLEYTLRDVAESLGEVVEKLLLAE